MNLAEKTCQPIRAGESPLPRKEAEDLLREIQKWSVREKALEREFRFKDFRQSMDFANNVAAVANEQDHHPDIFISYSKVTVTLSTHTIGGLSMNDFIVAAKIDLLPHR